MKTKAKKQADLEALTEQFKNSNSAMILSFSKLTVEKDQQFRNELRETGADYRVVKNTLARLAIEGTPFETAKEHFKGVTSVATIDGEPIDLSKVISKYVTENKDVFQFKAGVVDGRVIDFSEVEKIATLPSKEELIGKLLYLFNAPAQRLATVLNAIPRDLAIVLKQVSERTENIPGDATEAEAPKEEKPEDTKPETEAETEAEDESSTEETKAEEKVGEESAETTEEVKAEEAPEVQAKSDENSEEKAEEQKEEESAEEDAENSEEKES